MLRERGQQRCAEGQGDDREPAGEQRPSPQGGRPRRECEHAQPDTGGVSVGPHDHVKPALEELGVEEVFWGVALRPGKPTWFGTRDRRLVFGLPGNPVSAMVTFHLFVRPALAALQGADPRPRRTTATFDADYSKQPGRAHVLRCRLEAREDGWHVRPTKAQGSHVLTSMLDAEALAYLEVERGDVSAGERVEVEIEIL